jgi:threonine/homoserine/homoserine lactone efflux protein
MIMLNKIENVALSVVLNLVNTLGAAAIIWVGWDLAHSGMGQIPPASFMVAVGIAIVVRGVTLAAVPPKVES